MTNLSRGKGGGRAGETGVGVCFFGGGFDTGNLGVAALTDAVLTSLTRRVPSARLTIFDHGHGLRSKTIYRDGRRVDFDCFGARWSKRLYRADSLPNMRLSARFGGLLNPGAKRLGAARAVLDISGGDSFTDLYGMWRFRRVTTPKKMALENGVPLVLLPQTYGPFSSPEVREAAARLVRGAAMCWARDGRSMEVLRDLLGDAYDADRHKPGVDVAFLLRPERPETGVPDDIEEWIGAGHDRPLVGVNVSGLILNDPESARNRFGFKAEYGDVVDGFVRRLLKETDARVLLVPHVLTPVGHFESDAGACYKAAERLQDVAGDRLVVVPPEFDQCGMKWLISNCDWFCGTRMHSAIAALSSGVATSAISYSPKTLGVFETCGQGGHVADPQVLGTEEVIEHLWASWEARESAHATLAERLPIVKSEAREQMDTVAAFVRGGDWRPGTPAP